MKKQVHYSEVKGGSAISHKYWVPALEKSNSILNHIANSQRQLRLIDLVDLTEINKSSMYSLLKTMERLSWITKNRNDTYSIGPAFGSFGAVYFRQFNLLESFLTEAEKSVEEIGEPIQLGILDGQDVVYLALKDAGSRIRLATDPGSRFPAYASAIGKIQLTKLTPSKLKEVYQSESLEPKTDYTITNRAVLAGKLDEYRKHGFATEEQEAALGFCCVAAPIYNFESDIIAGVSFTMLEVAWDQKKEKAKEEIMDLAQRLSKRTGFKESFEKNRDLK